MLPGIVRNLFSKFGERPKEQSEFDDARQLIMEQGLDLDFYNRERFLTQDDVSKILEKNNVNENSAFYDFFVKYFELPNGKGEDLDSIPVILSNDYWSDEYPEIGERYLQLTSIEGEGSYFYDKETDAVYDVNWGEEEEMISGKMQPWFTSFYDFLEWYYGDIDELD